MIRYLCITMLCVLNGCVSAQRAHEMDGFSLVSEHHRHIDIFNSANMAIVDELVARGGLSAEAREEYAQGALVHSWRPTTLWDGPAYYIYSWDAMGFTKDEVLAFYMGASTGNSRTSYSVHGSVTSTSFGRGTVMTRGTRTIRTIR